MRVRARAACFGDGAGVLRPVMRARFDRGWTSSVSGGGVRILLAKAEPVATDREAVQKATMKATSDLSLAGMLR